MNTDYPLPETSPALSKTFQGSNGVFVKYFPQGGIGNGREISINLWAFQIRFATNQFAAWWNYTPIFNFIRKEYCK